MTRELLQGLARFRKDYFPRFEDHYQRLVAEGQKPRTLFVGCSDSRVVPDRFTDAAPGALFVVRNVGNIIPPFEADSSHHGVSAAIEYAVEILGVRDIIVCGHSHCGAIRALYEPPPNLPAHVASWLELAEAARADEPLSEELLRRTEKRSVVLQLGRLMEFPGVRERVEAGEIALHGWHYVLQEGAVHVLDYERGEFVPSGG
ncbi:MAG TPA: carbonic anhydrase [Longimicrobiales bacterium]|nr:carbonic anhydrase [Longimicrobiales bacterium]